MTGNAKEVPAFIERDKFEAGIFEQPDKSGLAVYKQAFRACIELGDEEGAEKDKRLMESNLQ